MYKRFGKRAIDIALSGLGLVLLSPLFLIITLAIKLEDPGPVFFRQKRVGIHKSYFNIVKFRSMRQDMGKRTLFENLMVLDKKHDPFCTGKSAGVCLVYRARLLQEFEHCEIIVEYHEELDPGLVQDIAFATDYLNAFQTRARKAVQIRLLDKDEAERMAENMEKMDTLDKGISRQLLARWTGEMHRKGQL